MKAAHGRVFKYGDNVDTDVIIPARYLNSSDPKELATHCMEDIDKDFVNNVKRACTDCHQGCRRKLCYRRDICKNFLQKCNQYRSSYY